MLSKPSILSLFLNSFNINSIKHEHSCKILYVLMCATKLMFISALMPVPHGTIDL